MAELSDKARKALRLFEDGCTSYHDQFVEYKLRAGYRSYRAVIDQGQAAKLAAENNEGWQLRVTPQFVQHFVESNLSGLVDPEFRYRVKPRPRLFDQGEFQRVKAGAKAHEILHGSQLKEDRFDEKQWPFALQDAICGLTVSKQFWRRERIRKPHLAMVADQISGLPRMVEVEGIQTVFDGPTTEVVNVEDFYWHEAATELQKSPVIAHRVWMHYTDLVANKASDDKPYGYQNLDDLKDARDRGNEYSANRVADGSSRSKDMIEVLEIWWREDDGEIWCVTLGNRKAELKSPRKNPFWHGEYPFVVCSTRPDLFSIPGIGQVEKMSGLQAAHWDLENQTRANVALLNNAIYAVNLGMVDDLDAFVHEPGARWPVEGPVEEAIKQIAVDTIPADLALPHLAKLEQWMQNMGGGQPFSSTSESKQIGADTATEAALVTNLAQRATVRLKQQLNYAYQRIGQQRLELNQQFIRTPLAVEQIGLDNEPEQLAIMPYLLQGQYLFDITPMNESLMRAEKRAEGQALLQVLQPWVAIQLQLGQSGAATPLNTDALIEYLLEQYDIGDPKRFFSSRTAPAPNAGGAPSGAEQQPDGQTLGTTGPHSIDPSVSPASNASMSGETLMQRALAMRGGAVNV